MKANQALQAIMDEKGVTHVRLAKDLGVSPQAVDMRCSDGRVMRIDTLAKTYGALGYKIVACPKDGVGREYELDG